MKNIEFVFKLANLQKDMLAFIVLCFVIIGIFMITILLVKKELKNNVK